MLQPAIVKVFVFRAPSHPLEATRALPRIVPVLALTKDKTRARPLT